MKIAIPTIDGIHISDQELFAKGFHVFTIASGEIIDEELRWNNANNDGSANEDIIGKVNDCSVILVNKAFSDLEGNLRGKEIIRVNDLIITKIIWNYLAEVRRKEANTCCCP